MFNQNQWHAEKATYRAVTGGAYRLLGPYGRIVEGSSFPSVGTIPIAETKQGTIISDGIYVRGTDTKFTADVQEEDFIFAQGVVRKVRYVITDTLLELEGGFPADISVGIALQICKPQVYNSILAKNTGNGPATVQGAPYSAGETYFQGGAPISYDAGSGTLEFTLSI